MGGGCDRVSNSKLKRRALGDPRQWQQGTVWSGATQTTDWGKRMWRSLGREWGPQLEQYWGCLPSAGGTGARSIES